MVRVACAPFLWKKLILQGGKLILKMKLLKVYLSQNQCCITSFFYFSRNSERIKNFDKNYQKTDNSIEIPQGRDEKPSNDYDVVR